MISLTMRSKGFQACEVGETIDVWGTFGLPYLPDLTPLDAGITDENRFFDPPRKIARLTLRLYILKLMT